MLHVTHLLNLLVIICLNKSDLKTKSLLFFSNLQASSHHIMYVIYIYISPIYNCLLDILTGNLLFQHKMSKKDIVLADINILKIKQVLCWNITTCNCSFRVLHIPEIQQQLASVRGQTMWCRNTTNLNELDVFM